MPIAEQLPDGSLTRHPHVETSVYARTAAEDVTDSDGNILVTKGTDLSDPIIEKLIEAGITTVKIRSVLTCESGTGVCAVCYGRSMATGKLVDVGEAVGIVAAQSIGEPGTQLTMRTFHRVVWPVTTSPPVCRVCRSCSRPASRRARPRSPMLLAASAWRTTTGTGRSPSSRTTAATRSSTTSCRSASASR